MTAGCRCPVRIARKYPLTCGFGARGGIRTLDLPITGRTEAFQLGPARTIVAAQVRTNFVWCRLVVPGISAWVAKEVATHPAWRQRARLGLTPRPSDCGRKVAARRQLQPSDPPADQRRRLLSNLGAALRGSSCCGGAGSKGTTRVVGIVEQSPGRAAAAHPSAGPAPAGGPAGWSSPGSWSAGW
jgi:hypothetical protein